MIVSIVNNFKTISFQTPDIASKTANTKLKRKRHHMQFLCINIHYAAFDQ